MRLEDRILATFPEEEQIPAEVRLEPVEQREWLVGGQIRTWEGAMQEVLSPVCTRAGSVLTQRRIGAHPLLGEKEALEALEAASAAYGGGRGRWPTMSVGQRIEHVSNFAKQMQDRRRAIADLLMWEVGKSRQDSEKEFDRTVEYIQDTIDALKDLDRRCSRFEVEAGIIGQIRRAPLGVVLCMGPFNYPLNETVTTLLPALIMGNTVVFKPAKLGVLLWRPLLEAFRDSFPPGVINTLYGDGRTVVGPLMSSGKIDVLAFIGSARVGNLLKKQHPYPNRLRCILGLDAKNPAIVLPDADLDLAVRECLLGSLSFNGQRCTALKMLFVHRQLVEPFLERFGAAVGQLKFGMPWDSGVTLTPLPEPGKTQHLAELVADAVRSGAQVVNEGGGTSAGTFFYPAVLYPVATRARVYEEEQFGPIVPVRAYDEVEEPIQYIVESNVGQQASIFGKDPDAIAALVDPLVNQVCRVNINSQCQRGPDTFPFTGRKDSAEATLSVSDALRAFSIRTLVAAKDTELNKSVITSIVRGRKSNFLSTDFLL